MRFVPCLCHTHVVDVLACGDDSDNDCDCPCMISDALPEGWEIRESRSTGETYYLNVFTEESTYDCPTEPAPRIAQG